MLGLEKEVVKEGLKSIMFLSGCIISEREGNGACSSSAR
jgi:hypothetical protein